MTHNPKVGGSNPPPATTAFPNKSTRSLLATDARVALSRPRSTTCNPNETVRTTGVGGHAAVGTSDNHRQTPYRRGVESRRGDLMRTLALVLALSCAACGSDGPTTPTTVTPSPSPAPAPTPAPTPAPQPAPPPAPVYPNMIGAWAGTATINASILGLSASNICQLSWIITAQNGGEFNGTFQTSGGTTLNCAQSGRAFGAMTQSGAITNLNFEVSIGPVTGCTLLSSDPYAGIATSASLTAQANERLSCVSNGVTVPGTRSLTVALTKR